MSNAIRKHVEGLVEIELENANLKFPLFHSSHEGYAILKEEVEECEDELTEAKRYMNYTWLNVKLNNSQAQLDCIEQIQIYTENLVCEAIQVAAMCKKYKMLLDGEK